MCICTQCRLVYMNKHILYIWKQGLKAKQMNKHILYIWKQGLKAKQIMFEVRGCNIWNKLAVDVRNTHFVYITKLILSIYFL